MLFVELSCPCCTGVSSRLKQLWCGIVTEPCPFDFIFSNFVRNLSHRFQFDRIASFFLFQMEKASSVFLWVIFCYLIIWICSFWSATAFTIAVYQFNFLVKQYTDIGAYAILKNASGKILKVLLRSGDVIKFPINFVCNQFENIPKIWITISSLSYGFLPCKLYQSFSLIQEFNRNCSFVRLFVSLLAFHRRAHRTYVSDIQLQVYLCMCSIRSCWYPQK